jgi:hypothetical protein
MASIITRTGKGSALEWAEVDANFTNLNADKAEKTTVQCYVQPTAPTPPAGQTEYLWVQTGMGLSGNDFTFWINT